MRFSNKANNKENNKHNKRFRSRSPSVDADDVARSPRELLKTYERCSSKLQEGRKATNSVMERLKEEVKIRKEKENKEKHKEKDRIQLPTKVKPTEEKEKPCASKEVDALVTPDPKIAISPKTLPHTNPLSLPSSPPDTKASIEQYKQITDRGCGSLSEYKRVKLIGEGTYGTVYKATNKNMENVALKKVKISENKNMSHFPITSIREINILNGLNHPNVIGLRDVVVDEKEDDSNGYDSDEDGITHFPGAGMGRVSKMKFDVYLVMDYIETDLKALLHKIISSHPKAVSSDTSRYMSVAEIKSILYQLLLAVEYIHGVDVIHRDIKPANLLMSKNGYLKLCDFGLARKFSNNHVVTTPSPSLPSPFSPSPCNPSTPSSPSSISPTDGSYLSSSSSSSWSFSSSSSSSGPSQPSAPLTPQVVTLYYRPPEVLLGSKWYGPSLDMWSVGCIFYELLTGDILFPGRTEIEQFNQMLNVMGAPSEHEWPEFRELAANHHFNVQKLKHAGKLDSQIRNKLHVVSEVPLPPCSPLDKSKLSSLATSAFPSLYSPSSPSYFYQTHYFLSESGLDLLHKMLKWNPSQRITAEDALNHPFFQQLPLPSPVNLHRLGY